MPTATARRPAGSPSSNRRARAAAGPEAPPAASGIEVDQRVYEAVSRALLSGKLRPGAPLRERALAEALGCSRGAVRKVLARMGVEKRLVLEHNRGAFVPDPSEEDMRGVYRARRIVEAGLVGTLWGRLGREHAAALRRHVKAEQKAFKEGRREDAFRLAGEFHLLLARIAGSAELFSYMQRLVSHTELYKALFDSVEAASCAPREHEEIIDALGGPSLKHALQLAMAHLDELEQRVISGARAERENDDLVRILASASAPPRDAAAPSAKLRSGRSRPGTARSG